MNAWHSLLFFVGVFLLFGGVMLGVGALEYEVVSLGTVEEVPEDTESLVDYCYLSERDRGTVDRVIAGERLVFRDPSDLPGPTKKRGKLAVNRDGSTYLITRRMFFNVRTTFGAASATLSLLGFVGVFEAIRRHHFPNRSILPVRGTKE